MAGSRRGHGVRPEAERHHGRAPRRRRQAPRLHHRLRSCNGNRRRHFRHDAGNGGLHHGNEPRAHPPCARSAGNEKRSDHPEGHIATHTTTACAAPASTSSKWKRPRSSKRPSTKKTAMLFFFFLNDAKGRNQAQRVRRTGKEARPANAHRWLEFRTSTGKVVRISRCRVRSRGFLRRQGPARPL